MKETSIVPIHFAVSKRLSYSAINLLSVSFLIVFLFNLFIHSRV